MIINNAPQHEAIISNVGEIGDFKIKASAKAFSILSSGLYANKIRAIIRELSCNAVDSHAAAGKKDTPFDVHLPNSLEPWFSIRDYGTGLSHEQVTQIYTTYFESTKTASNEFIGALGLGSKSPFSYTDNFTVTAVQNGNKGIYSAFINAEGVPSIALMMTEVTDEPNGVEVKFSVNDRYDYDKFKQEARTVYTHFSLRPVISGDVNFKFTDVEYETENIIPGVHSTKGHRSVAVMGNIAYPIDIPDSSDLDGLSSLLNCGLVMNFGIGELDFQASREGLSYIPQTINAIKGKLTALNAQLAVHIAEEADKIENLWERAAFLARKRESALWRTAVEKYAKDSPIPTFVEDKYGGFCLQRFNLKISDLATKYNIQIRGFNRSRHSKTVNNLKSETEYGAKLPSGHYETWGVWRIGVSPDTHFIINDLKTGAGERARYHYRTADCTVYTRHVFVLDPIDRTKPAKTAEFLKAIHNPPSANIINASALMQRERTSMGQNVTIMRLEERKSGGYYREREMVWRDAGKADSFVDTETYYYVPLSGFQMVSSKGYTSGKELHDDVKAMPGLFKGSIYGVRKLDIEEIKKCKNWINFEDHIATVMNNKDNSKLLLGLVKSKLDKADVLGYNNSSVLDYVDANSPYAKLVSVFEGVEKFNGNEQYLSRLMKKFAPTANLSPEALVSKYQVELNDVNRRYPLLKSLSSYRIEASDIAEYVNLIDAKKGI